MKASADAIATFEDGDFEAMLEQDVGTTKARKTSTNYGNMRRRVWAIGSAL